MSLQAAQSICHYKILRRRSLSNSLSRIEVTTERIRLNINAHQKPATLMPSTNRLASNTTKALITNKNKPRVIMVTGSVRRMRSGFTKMLRIASTTANTKAVQNVSIWIPLRTCARPNETAAITNMRIRNLIELFSKVKQ